MGLDVTCRCDRGVTVVGVAGEMDFANAQQLTMVMDQVLEAGHREVVVDLDELTFLDSGGLGAVVAAWKATRSAGGSLQLVCDNGQLLRMLGLTGLINVFGVHPSLGAYLQVNSH